MGFQAQMLKKFPGIIKYADKEANVLKRIKKAVSHAYNSKFYSEKLGKANYILKEMGTYKMNLCQFI